MNFLHMLCLWSSLPKYIFTMYIENVYEFRCKIDKLLSSEEKWLQKKSQ
jgi:hypothetical protein